MVLSVPLLKRQVSIVVTFELEIVEIVELYEIVVFNPTKSSGTGALALAELQKEVTV